MGKYTIGKLTVARVVFLFLDIVTNDGFFEHETSKSDQWRNLYHRKWPETIFQSTYGPEIFDSVDREVNWLLFCSVEGL